TDPSPGAASSPQPAPTFGPPVMGPTPAGAASPAAGPPHATPGTTPAAAPRRSRRNPDLHDAPKRFGISSVIATVGGLLLIAAFFFPMFNGAVLLSEIDELDAMLQGMVVLDELETRAED